MGSKQNKTSFKKGQAKTGGRQKGSLNKITAPIKELLAEYSQANWERFQVEINRLEGIDYVKTYLALLEYVTPKLQRITLPTELYEEPRNTDRLSTAERRELIDRLRTDIGSN
jgi:hypothetical protein